MSDDSVRPLRKGDLGEGHIPAPPRISRSRAVRNLILGLVALIGGYALIRQFVGFQAAAAFLLGWALHDVAVRH